MRLGSFAGGLSQGINNGMRIARMQQEYDAEEQRKADEMAVRDATRTGLSSAQAEADRINSQQVEGNYGLKEAYNVPGVGVTADADFAKGQAENQAFIDGNDAPQVEKGYTAPGVGFSKDYSEAQSLAAGQDMEGLKSARPKVTADEVFWKKYSGGVRDAYLKTGQVDKAAAWDKFAEDRNNDAYGKAWASAVVADNQGDYAGAVKHLETLYNRDVPDGKFVKVEPGENGQYTMTTYDEASGKPVDARTMHGAQLSQMGIQMLNPTKFVEYKMRMDAQNAKENYDFKKQVYLQDRSDARAEARDDRKAAEAKADREASDKRLDKKLANERGLAELREDRKDARGKGDDGKLTRAQERENENIKGARKRTNGVLENDPRLQKYDKYGAVNPKYDPQLYQDVELAQKRLYGADAEQDKWTKRKSPQATGANQNPAYAEYKSAYDQAIAAGRKDIADKITARARQNGVVK